jgi:GNAT superfamily N-acetyltransferase
MAAVTLESWRGAYADLIPEGALEGVSVEDVAKEWRLAVSSDASPRHTVLVALEGATVVGYAVLAPSADPDADSAQATGEIVDLVVDAAHQRHGHGSRLLAAAVDHQRGSGAADLITWVIAQDDPRAAFLRSAGFEADGATRTLDAGEGSSGVRQVRYSALL